MIIASWIFEPVSTSSINCSFTEGRNLFSASQPPCQQVKLTSIGSESACSTPVYCTGACESSSLDLALNKRPVVQRLSPITLTGIARGGVTMASLECKSTIYSVGLFNGNRKEGE